MIYILWNRSAVIFEAMVLQAPGLHAVIVVVEQHYVLGFPIGGAESVKDTIQNKVEVLQLFGQQVRPPHIL